MFEKRVLRRLFGSRKDEMTSDWRKTHNERPHKLPFSPVKLE
jgi:hypothetical protein